MRLNKKYILLKYFSQRKNNGSKRREYLNNISWLMIDNVYRMIISYFVIVYVSRYLGPGNFGILSYAQSIVAIGITFGTLGLDTVVLREYMSRKSEENEILGSAFLLKLSASIFAVFCVYLSAYWSTDSIIEKKIIYIISFSAIIKNLGIIDVYIRANLISKYTAYANSIGNTLSSLFKMYLVFYAYPLVWFAWAILLDYVLVSAGFIIVYNLQNNSIFDWKARKNTVKYFAKKAIPLLIVALSAILYTRTDQIMLKNMLGNESAGIYSAAIKVSELFYFIPQIICNILYSHLINVKKNGKIVEFKYFIYRVYRIIFYLSITLSAGVYFGSDFIIYNIFGELYKESSIVLKPLSIAIILYSVGSWGTKILLVEKLENDYAVRTMVGAILNIILNYFMIRKYGIVGAAWSTIITLFFVHFVYDLFNSKIRIYLPLKLLCLLPLKKSQVIAIVKK